LEREGKNHAYKRFHVRSARQSTRAGSGRQAGALRQVRRRLEFKGHQARAGRRTPRSRRRIHFGWILQGRAVQDVWMIPRLEDRAKAPASPAAGNWYGTTLRVYDPEIDAWRIWWIDPATNAFRQQIGRARGADIVQEGRTDAGDLTRWSFTEIRPDSFHWLGEASDDGGASWQLQVEVLARRR